MGIEQILHFVQNDNETEHLRGDAAFDGWK